MKKIVTLLCAVLFTSVAAFSQQRPQPPVSLELMFGNKKSAGLMSMNKQIAGPFRYLNITSVASTYELEKGKPELIMINSFSYQMHKYFGAGAGLQYHFLKGLVPSVSVNASYITSDWGITLLPFINLRPDVNSETALILEYKPQLNENLRLFSRALGLYNHNLTLGEHDRSFYYLRLGLTMKQFSVGAAANLDYYGPKKFNQNNYGGFVLINI